MFRHQCVSVVFIVVICSNVDIVATRSKEEWKGRVIYQLLTDRFAPPAPTPSAPCPDLRSRCGGNFQGIIDQLDYIKGLGVDAIWISPIVKNIRNGYHGYWAENIFQIEPHWGTESDFRRLIAAAHAMDLWVMVDVVPNHMGYPANCTWDLSDCTPSQNVDYSSFAPFDKEEHFHTFCIVEDYNNQSEVEYCRLANLPDLNQDVAEVRETLLEWISALTLEYGVDGYRIDAARHVGLEFWSAYQSASGAMCMAEVSSDDIGYNAAYQGPQGLDSVLNFPLRSALHAVLAYSNHMAELADNLDQQRQQFHDVSVLGTFADNHDGARFLNVTDDLALVKNALTYVFFGEGIPIVYYGTEQAFRGGNDPDCRESLWPHYDTNSEMYRFIQYALNYRKTVTQVMLSSNQEVINADNNTFVFSRAELMILVILTNAGSGNDITKTIIFDRKPDGASYVNIRDPDDVITVRVRRLTFHLESGEPKVYRLEAGPLTISEQAHALSVLIRSWLGTWIYHRLSFDTMNW